jgi:hypothetical protein
MLVSIEEWKRLGGPMISIKEWLMTDFARGNLNIPPRGKLRRRPPPRFD